MGFRTNESTALSRAFQPFPAPSSTKTAGTIASQTLTQPPAPSANSKSGSTTKGPAPQSPTQTTSREMTPAVFNRMAGLLHAASRDLINGSDVVLGIFTVFLSFSASIKRVGGCVQPDEAAALVRAAAKLPPEQRNILAAALQYERIAFNDGRYPRAAIEAVSWDGHDKSEVDATFDAFIAANPPNKNETKIGRLLGSSDALINAAHDVLTEASVATKPDTVIDTARLDAVRKRFEAISADVPPGLAAAARKYVRDTIYKHDTWPAKFDANTKGLADLRDTLFPIA